ncbi:MAG: 2-hydroxymuconate semialdehyde hydrolase [Chlamydiia bacterium]|nr:2-hydroxymuconate semialdehyde hydrolase [Chlamydiia bacterium]
MPYTIIEGKNCSYQDLGEGFPILLGHSYLWSSEMWQPQLEELSKEFRCIVPDLWDHGESDHLTGSSTTVESLANHTWKLMESLGITEFAVVGLSVGGMWGAELALNHPESVKALVLMNTFLGSEPEITQKKYFALLDMIEKEKGFSEPLLNQIVPLFFSPATATINPKLMEDFKTSLREIKEENIPGIVTIGRAIFSRECKLDKLTTLKQPTLILVGEDDIPRPPRESQEMASRIPGSLIHVIEKAGHISNLEQPEVVSTLLKNFIKKAVYATNSA